MRQEKQQLNNEHPEAIRSASRERTSAGHDHDVADDRDARDEFHEPGPVPTAFGATSVGGSVAASALASPRPEDEPDPREERTARPGDGAVDGEREGWRADPTAEVDRAGNTPQRPERAARGGSDDTAAAGGYGSATPTMVDPDAQSPNGTGATVPAGAATLFDDTTAQEFRDRWHDIQLRFVDDPQAAAGEAQSLVDEAMQALSTALKEHKRKLGAWQEAGSTDTEQLRMAVRQYRDFLDRVLGR